MLPKINKGSSGYSKASLDISVKLGSNLTTEIEIDFLQKEKNITASIEKTDSGIIITSVSVKHGDSGSVEVTDEYFVPFSKVKYLQR